MKTERILRVLGLLLVWLACAVAAAPAATAAPEEANPLGMDFATGPLYITSDTLTAHNEGNRAVFEGNVRAVQGDTTVQAREVSVWYSGEPANAEDGAPAQQAVSRIRAEGGVRITTPRFTAEADLAVYEETTGALTLTGDKAVLSRGRSVVEGSTIVLLMREGRLTVEGSADAQVKAVFYPGDAPADMAPAPEASGARP